MEFNKPDPLKMTGNLAENFKNFKQQLQIYFDATESHTKKEATQVAILLNLLGSDGLKIYNTLKIPNKTIFEILKALEAYCIPKRNETMELYKFFTRKQLNGEAFDKYYADLRELVKSCELDTCEDKLLKTQIILGIFDKELQAKLLREELTLEKTVKHCQIVEQSDVNRKLIQEDTKTLFNIEAERNKGVQSNFKEKNVKFINDCTRCGRSHKVNDCPAYGKICTQCGLKNHFRNKCRKGEISVLKIQGQINNIETDNMCVSIDALKIMNTENNVINNNKSWIEKIRINDMETKIKLDTGAELNVISVEMIKKMKDIQLWYITKFKGKVILELENNKIKLYRLFEVVEYEGLSLLSYEACVSMQYKMPEISIINSLITNNKMKEFIEKNIDVFEGIEEKDEDIKDKFYEELERVYDTLPLHCIKIVVEQRKAVVNSATEILGIKPKEKNKNWFNDLRKNAIIRRNELRKKALQNTSDECLREYEEQRKLTNKVLRREKRLNEKKK
ncbi:hypothetical protein QTP88_017331 [Uroleucon formosanum]